MSKLIELIVSINPNVLIISLSILIQIPVILQWYLSRRKSINPKKQSTNKSNSSIRRYTSQFSLNLKKIKPCNIKENNSVIDIYYKKKKTQFENSILVITMVLLFYVFSQIYLRNEIKKCLVVILVICATLVLIAKSLLYYRIKSGYYGTNYEEARELLYYIKQDNDKNNRNSGKKILNDEKKYQKLRSKVKSPLIN